MKTIYLMAALAAFQLTAAQSTIQVKEFKNIAVSGDIEMKLVKGSENKVVTDDEEEVRVSCEGGNLLISGDGEATVYYTGKLEGISAGADTVIYGPDEIKAKSFNLAAAADSEVALNINSDIINIAAAADSEVRIKGKADKLIAAIASDAEFNCKDLKAKDVTIDVASDGEAIINATGTVDATVASDAELTIYGKPKKVNETKSADAEITVVR